MTGETKDDLRFFGGLIGCAAAFVTILAILALAGTYVERTYLPPPSCNVCVVEHCSK